MFGFFSSEATVKTQPSPGSSATAPHPSEEHPKGSGRLANLARRFATFKSMLFCPSYYDPYQREQQAEDASHVTIDARPAKAQAWSVASAVISGVVNRICYSAAKVMPGYLWNDNIEEEEKPANEKKTSPQRYAAFTFLFQSPGFWEYRIQQVHHFIKTIYSQKEKDEQKDPLTNAAFFPPLAMEAYRQVLEDEKNAWGIVFRENLIVHFMQPFAPSILEPPPKPRRTCTRH